MPSLRLSILGAGNVAESYIRQIRRLREDGVDVELVAICGRRAEPAAQLAARFGIARHGTDFSALLASDDIDGVVILTPMQSHEEHVRLTLQAGKHVLVEKTMAGTASEARALVNLAEDRHLCLMSAPFTVLSPVFRDAHRRISSGEIGTINSCRALYGWAGPDWAPWFHEADAGALRDLGVYGLTTLTGLLGPVRTVFAHGQEAPRDGAAPANLHVSLAFASGCIGVLTTGFGLQKYRTPGIEVYGSKGTLQFAGQDWDPQGLDVWTQDSGCWKSYETPFAWPWTDGVRAFCASIISEKQPEIHPSHALHVLEIIDQALASVRSRRMEELRSSFIAPPIHAAADLSVQRTAHNPLILT